MRGNELFATHHKILFGVYSLTVKQEERNTNV